MVLIPLRMHIPRHTARTVLAVLMSLLPLPAAGAVEEIVIASGSEGGVYATFGGELASYLNHELGDAYRITSQYTDGSIQNVQKLLLEPRTQIALCQEDVAHFYYTGANNEFFFVSRANDLRITSLGRLFLEDLYIVVKPEIESFDDIARCFVGLPKSGSYATYTSLRRSQRNSWEEIQNGDRYRLFQRDSIDAFVEVSTTPDLKLLRFAHDDPRLRLLTVHRTDLSLGLDIYQDSAIPDSLSPSGQSLETAAVPACLLVTRNLPREIADLILQIYVDPDVVDRFFVKSKRYLAQITANTHGAPAFRGISQPRLTNLPVPLHPAAIRHTLGPHPYAGFINALIALSVVWFLWILVPLRYQRVRSLLREMRTTRFVYRDVNLVLTAVAWVFIVAASIKFLEIRELLAGRVLSGSSFVGMSFAQILNWLVVFSTTGFEDQVFPASPLAKMLAVSVQIVGIALLTYAGARLISFFVAQLIKRRDIMNLSSLSGHIVICNWNTRGTNIVAELRNRNVPQDKRKRTILILEESPQAPLPQDYADLYHIGRPPWHESTLRQAAVGKADSVIILLPEGAETNSGSDGAVLRTALAVNTFLSTAGVDSGPHVVAEFENEHDTSHLDALGIAGSISAKDVGMSLLAQTVASPGITSVMEELLTCAPDSNEVYTVPVPESLTSGPASFKRIVEHFLPTLRSNLPVLPIGLRIRRKDGGEGASAERADASYSVLVAPSTSELSALGVTTFQSDDQILVLADTEPS